MGVKSSKKKKDLTACCGRLDGCSVTQSCPTLQFYGLQHTRAPCRSPSPGFSSGSCPLSQWHHPHPILCHPLLLLPSVFPSIRVVSNESALRIWWPEYWSFSISPSSEYSGWISFRIDWLGLLAVRRLKALWELKVASTDSSQGSRNLNHRTAKKSSFHVCLFFFEVCSRFFLSESVNDNSAQPVAYIDISYKIRGNSIGSWWCLEAYHIPQTS